MGTRNAGEVYIRGIEATVYTTAATTSGGVAILSVSCPGASEFVVANVGSINIYIQGSFDGTFFYPSVNCYRQIGGGAYSAVECISASTVATFNGPFRVVQVMANSGSGIYRAHLAIR